MKNITPQVRSAGLPEEGSTFLMVPKLVAQQPNFDYIIHLLQSNTSFTFCKINHGFWERLARLEKIGVSRSVFFDTSGEKIDTLLKISGTQFAEGGMLTDLLTRMQLLTTAEQGLLFVPSLSPWPLSRRIEGTPIEGLTQCMSLINHFVPQAYLNSMEKYGFTGYEFKVAAITGQMSRFVNALSGRHVLLITSHASRALMDATELDNLEVIEVDEKQARLNRDVTRQLMFDYLEQYQALEQPPIVVTSMGGAFATWLGFQAHETFDTLQFVDLGGALAAYACETAAKQTWSRAYRRQLSENIQVVSGLSNSLVDAYTGPYGLRDTELVAQAASAGVPVPRGISLGEIAAPMPASPIPFIENKIYDHARIADFLSLSVIENHHANAGPVSRVLESAIASVARLPLHRKVIAVSSGTAALHLACGYHAYRQGRSSLGWVTSAFNFFSSQIGSLADTLVIDCNATGGFDFNALRALPINDYDGVICTNIFAQNSNWEALAKFCHKFGKPLVIDNATGLCDRSKVSLTDSAPIEIVSGHHTKPWGVGEGGFIICDAEQEPVLRQLANFGACLSSKSNPMAANAKISDLAAAAILDRLERMPYWSFFYQKQERRNRSLMINANLGIIPLKVNTKIHSPRAHTPFLSPHPVDIDSSIGAVTLRKYYRPLTPLADASAQFVNAMDLYSRIFCLSNSPEMRLVSDEDIIDQVTRMVTEGKGQVTEGD